MSKNVLIGVCGGIAAYKIPALVSLLVQEGYRVRVVLSESGQHFVSRETLQVLSGQRVFGRLWDEPDILEDSPVLHINLVDEADIFLLAPASYNWIGKAANGLADDLLSTLFAAWPAAKKPLLFAAAMNPEMWQQPIVQKNIEYLQNIQCELIAPESGFLACRAEGQGRMVEAEELFFRLESRLKGTTLPLKNKLKGKRILLTAGPTYEALDPVRYISNRSSGRTGIALACAARDLGAEVSLILGQKNQTSGKLQIQGANQRARAKMNEDYWLSQELFGIRVLPCHSAEEMAELASEAFADCDWALAVAAVCDFRPVHAQEEKIKKEPGQEIFPMEFRLNPDILAHWGQHKEGQKVLGFALENSAAAQQYALNKMSGKQCDAIVLNSPSNLEGEQAQAQVFFALGAEVDIPLQNKRDFAAELLLLLVEHWC